MGTRGFATRSTSFAVEPIDVRGAGSLRDAFGWKTKRITNGTRGTLTCTPDGDGVSSSASTTVVVPDA
jgi:hypothetical protein